MKSSALALPLVGEAVRVVWGLASVHGHVVEVYEGTRPRVVVEIDPGVVDDSAATVTVPLAAIDPDDSSDSEWAQGARYERAVASALRSISGQLSSIEFSAVEGDREIDILAESKDGRLLVIETKSRPVAGDVLESALTQVKETAHTLGANWLLVAPDITIRESPDSDHLVRWPDEEDDSSFGEVLRQALLESPSSRL